MFSAESAPTSVVIYGILSDYFTLGITGPPVPSSSKTTNGLAIALGVGAYGVLRFFVFPDMPFWLAGAALAIGCVLATWMLVAYGIVPLIKSWNRPPDTPKHDA